VTRQSRLLVVLVVISGVGVAGLTVMANQYRKALAIHPAMGNAGAAGVSPNAARLVDGFLAARGAVKGALREGPERIGAARSGALGAYGMSTDDYVAVRRAWRAFRASQPVNDPALGAAFEAKRHELAEADLGAAEAVDDAVK